MFNEIKCLFFGHEFEHSYLYLAQSGNMHTHRITFKTCLCCGKDNLR